MKCFFNQVFSGAFYMNFIKPCFSDFINDISIINSKLVFVQLPDATASLEPLIATWMKKAYLLLMS